VGSASGPIGVEAQRRGRRSAALAALLLLALLVGCGAAARAPQPEHPVVLIGLDGLEWNVVLTLLRDGRLPHLAALMRRGVTGELRTLEPTLSPVIWTTIATGLPPERHGIRDFTEGKGETLRLLVSTDRREKAFWNVASEHGLRVAVVGWWLTWPVEPIHGVMVAQVNVRRGRFGFAKGGLLPTLEHQVHPPERQAEILALVPDDEATLRELVPRVLGSPWTRGLGRVANRLWQASLWSLVSDADYRRVALELLARDEPYDLFAVYFGGSDVLGHRFWRYLEPERYQHPPDEAEIQVLRDVIPAYYAHLDRVVGELVAAAAQDAVVLVISDHGMSPARTDFAYREGDPLQALLSGNHRAAEPAFFVAAGPGVRAAGRVPASRGEVLELGSVLDVMPTLCALLDLPIARDFEGEVLTSVLEPALLAARPLRSVASHTPGGWYRERARPQVPDRLRDARMRERMEQLRALGYIE
jgi:hypothetical protein